MISYDISIITHRHSFLVQEVATANTASFAGAFWFTITFLLGGQPSCTLQCSALSSFQPVILMAILTLAPHHPGLQYMQNSSLYRDTQPRLAGSRGAGCLPQAPLPSDQPCQNLGQKQGLELGLLGPSVNVATSSTAPCFAKKDRKKRQ